MTHRNWKMILILTSIAGVLVFSRSLLGEEKKESATATPSEIIAKKIRTKMVSNYQNAPLGKVIEDIAKKADVKITFDPKGLEEEGVTEETPVILELKHEIMIKSTLNLILVPMHLTYEIMDDGIRICSESQFDARIVKRKYDIADVAPSPTELKRFKAEILSIAKKDAPAGTFKEDNVIFSEDGKQVTIEQARSVQFCILEFIRNLRHAKDQKERDQIYKGWVKLADYRYDSDK